MNVLEGALQPQSLPNVVREGIADWQAHRHAVELTQTQKTASIRKEYQQTVTSIQSAIEPTALSIEHALCEANVHTRDIDDARAALSTITSDVLLETTLSNVLQKRLQEAYDEQGQTVDFLDSDGAYIKRIFSGVAEPTDQQIQQKTRDICLNLFERLGIGAGQRNKTDGRTAFQQLDDATGNLVAEHAQELSAHVLDRGVKPKATDDLPMGVSTAIKADLIGATSQHILDLQAAEQLPAFIETTVNQLASNILADLKTGKIQMENRSKIVEGWRRLETQVRQIQFEAREGKIQLPVWSDAIRSVAARAAFRSKTKADQQATREAIKNDPEKYQEDWFNKVSKVTTVAMAPLILSGTILAACGKLNPPGGTGIPVPPDLNHGEKPSALTLENHILTIAHDFSLRVTNDTPVISTHTSNPDCTPQTVQAPVFVEFTGPATEPPLTFAICNADVVFGSQKSVTGAVLVRLENNAPTDVYTLFAEEGPLLPGEKVQQFGEFVKVSPDGTATRHDAANNISYEIRFDANGNMAGIDLTSGTQKTPWHLTIDQPANPTQLFSLLGSIAFQIPLRNSDATPVATPVLNPTHKPTDTLQSTNTLPPTLEATAKPDVDSKFFEMPPTVQEFPVGSEDDIPKILAKLKAGPSHLTPGSTPPEISQIMSNAGTGEGHVSVNCNAISGEVNCAPVAFIQFQKAGIDVHMIFNEIRNADGTSGFEPEYKYDSYQRNGSYGYPRVVANPTGPYHLTIYTGVAKSVQESQSYEVSLIQQPGYLAAVNDMVATGNFDALEDYIVPGS